MDRQKMGRRIKAARKAKGLTQSQLADAAGIDRSDMCNVEHGRIGVGLKRLSLIADALGMPLGDLLPPVHGGRN